MVNKKKTAAEKLHAQWLAMRTAKLKEFRSRLHERTELNTKARYKRLKEEAFGKYQSAMMAASVLSELIIRKNWREFEVLVHQGTDVNVQDESGMTALHHAAALGARPFIRMLVKSEKCDYLIRDAEGRYASDLAIEWSGDAAVGRLLTKHQIRQANERGIPAWERQN